MKLIPLSERGKNKGKYFTMVDDEDFDFLMQWRWMVNKNVKDDNKYALRSASVFEKKLGMTYVSIHQLLIGKPKNGFVIDHIDGNGLNNQKLNLRHANMKQNMWNLKKRKGANGRTTTSIYKGVSLRMSWRATITANGKKHHLGDFSNEGDAARAYDKAAKKFHGEFANINFK